MKARIVVQSKSKCENSNHTTNKWISGTSGSAMQPKKAARSVNQDLCIQLNKPTKVQSRVLEMDKNGFVEETNIRQLIRHKYGKLTEKEFQVKINHYFSLRYEWDEWRKYDCLNDLALKEDLSLFEMSIPGEGVVHLVSSDDDTDEVTVKMAKTSSATKPGTSSVRSIPLQRKENTMIAKQPTSKRHSSTECPDRLRILHSLRRYTASR